MCDKHQRVSSSRSKSSKSGANGCSKARCSSSTLGAIYLSRVQSHSVCALSVSVCSQRHGNNRLQKRLMRNERDSSFGGVSLTRFARLDARAANATAHTRHNERAKRAVLFALTHICICRSSCGSCQVEVSLVRLCGCISFGTATLETT